MVGDSGAPGAGSDVLMDRFSRRQLGFVFFSVVAALAAMLAAGATGPDAVFSQPPVDGDHVSLNNTCYYSSTGETTRVPSCWNRASALIARAHRIRLALTAAKRPRLLSLPPNHDPVLHGGFLSLQRPRRGR